MCVPNDNKEKTKKYINGKYIYEKEIKIIFKN